jgi:hypothetical protein
MSGILLLVNFAALLLVNMSRENFEGFSSQHEAQRKGISILERYVDVIIPYLTEIVKYFVY